MKHCKKYQPVFSVTQARLQKQNVQVNKFELLGTESAEGLLTPNTNP